MSESSRAETIRRLRSEGLTLREICERLSVPKSAVNRALYENVRAYEADYSRRRYYTATCEDCGKPCTFNPHAKRARGRWCADCYHVRLGASRRAAARDQQEAK